MCINMCAGGTLFGGHVHAEDDIVLRTDAQVLSDGAELRADVFAQDVRCAGGGREQACQDRPIMTRGEKRQPN